MLHKSHEIGAYANISGREEKSCAHRATLKPQITLSMWYTVARRESAEYLVKYPVICWNRKVILYELYLFRCQRRKTAVNAD